VGEKIGKALSSFIMQKDKDIFEIIFVDDGSTDFSIEYIKSFKRINELHYSLIKQNNKGVSAARNTGLKEAKGEYILFLDSDDYIHEDLISDLETIIIGRPDIIYWGFDSVDENGNVLQKYDDNYFYCDKTDLLLSNYLSLKTWLWTGSVLYRKSFLSTNAITFTEGKTYSEDIEFISKCIINSQVTKCIHRSYSFYVQNSGSLMKKMDYKRLQIIHTLFVIGKLIEQKEESVYFTKIFKPSFYWSCISSMIYYGMETEVIVKISKNRRFRRQIMIYKPKSISESIKKNIFLYIPKIFTIINRFSKHI